MNKRIFLVEQKNEFSQIKRVIQLKEIMHLFKQDN